jgi:hypothetical protein
MQASKSKKRSHKKQVPEALSPKCHCGGVLHQKWSPIKYRNPLNSSSFYGSIVCGIYWECEGCFRKYLSTSIFNEDFRIESFKMQFFLDRRGFQTEQDPINEIIVDWRIIS